MGMDRQEDFTFSRLQQHKVVQRANGSLGAAVCADTADTSGDVRRHAEAGGVINSSDSGRGLPTIRTTAKRKPGIPMTILFPKEANDPKINAILISRKMK